MTHTTHDGGRPVTPFARLHSAPGPLLLPNAWDHASAAALAVRGFEAVGTTSLGVAAALGVPDGAAGTADATLSLARRLGRDAFLFSVDAEGSAWDHCSTARRWPGPWPSPPPSVTACRRGQGHCPMPRCGR